MSTIHIFNHRAMATQFQVRLAGEDATYAAQAAQAAGVSGAAGWLTGPLACPSTRPPFKGRSCPCARLGTLV